MTTINDFFNTIFKGKPDDLYVLIWTMPDKKSHWLQKLDDAKKIITPEMIEKRDVYFGPGLSPKDYGPKARCKKDDIAGITSIWVDVDFGSGHKKKVPPDEETAGKLILQGGQTPSLVINSGGGWHCYWLMESPWIFKNDANRKQAEVMIKDWHIHLRGIFKAAGYELDATHDLSRVLRAPGTFNYKEVADGKG